VAYNNACFFYIFGRFSADDEHPLATSVDCWAVVLFCKAYTICIVSSGDLHRLQDGPVTDHRQWGLLVSRAYLADNMFNINSAIAKGAKLNDSITN